MNTPLLRAKESTLWPVFGCGESLLSLLCFLDQVYQGGHFVLRRSEYLFDLLLGVVLLEKILNGQQFEPAVRYLVTRKLPVDRATVLK